MPEITTDQPRIAEWFAKVMGNSCPVHEMVYIATESNGKITCATGYNGYNGKSINMHVALQGRFTKEARWYAFHYPFIELGVNKIIAPIDEANIKSLNIAKHFGFVTEAIIKDASLNGDLHLLTMTKEQCKYLR